MNYVLKFYYYTTREKKSSIKVSKYYGISYLKYQAKWNNYWYIQKYRGGGKGCMTSASGISACPCVRVIVSCWLLMFKSRNTVSKFIFCSFSKNQMFNQNKLHMIIPKVFTPTWNESFDGSAHVGNIILGMAYKIKIKSRLTTKIICLKAKTIVCFSAKLLSHSL